MQNLVNYYKREPKKVMPEELVCVFTIELLKMAEALQDAEIIHADVKPDNIMITPT